MKKITILILALTTFLSLNSCEKFLNVVPDKTGTINTAFKQRSKVKKYLYSIYAYVPNFADWNGVAGMLGGDELWLPPELYGSPFQGNFIARGLQTVVDPVYDSWRGTRDAQDLYNGIRKANIFMEKIDNVINMTETEKAAWVAEAKFLKAYFYFLLIRKYGSVVLYKKNIPVFGANRKIKVARSPIDSCYSYVIQLLDEVINTAQLDARPDNYQQNAGRIGKAIAYTVKAQVAAYRASPLYNGNGAYKNFQNVNGKNILYSEYNAALWDSAAVAAKEAIEYVTSHGYHLYTFPSRRGVTDTTAQKMTIRNSFALGTGKDRPNVIWLMTSSSTTSSQEYSMPYGVSYPSQAPLGTLSPPLKIAEMFYTSHGVPLKQDKSRNYSERYETQKVGASSRFNLRLGYTTAKLNFHREPRFYASLGFDGSIWYGQGRTDDTPASNLFYLRVKRGQYNAVRQGGGTNYSITGYFAKKRVNWKTVTVKGEGGSFEPNEYLFPLYRLEYLYLLYAEAKNEAGGPSSQVYKYLNLVRTHAGIPTVQESWNKWSTKPNQYKTKDGLRKIIHREMLIEFVFEGKRFWMLRRWKKADKYLNQNITGWNVDASSVENYYQKTIIFRQEFSMKNYLWPIAEAVLNRNPNLRQNPGW